MANKYMWTRPSSDIENHFRIPFYFDHQFDHQFAVVYIGLHQIFFTVFNSEILPWRGAWDIPNRIHDYWRALKRVTQAQYLLVWYRDRSTSLFKYSEETELIQALMQRYANHVHDSHIKSRPLLFLITAFINRHPWWSHTVKADIQILHPFPAEW